MRGGKRWMKSVIAAADENKVALPWQRGTRRAAMIRNRKVSSQGKSANA